jgi:hypothetical protein
VVIIKKVVQKKIFIFIFGGVLDQAVSKKRPKPPMLDIPFHYLISEL